MKFINEIPFNNADAAVTANGPAIYSALLLYVSVQVVTSASATPTVKLQASNDKGNPQNNFVPTNWVDIPSATVTATGGTVSLIAKTEIAYNWIRAVHTAGGTGTTTVNVFGIGA